MGLRLGKARFHLLIGVIIEVFFFNLYRDLEDKD
jgi:hypothetical protein